MSVSEETIEIVTKMIKQAEGYQPHQYKDNAKQQNRTIYWGHLIKPGEKFNNTAEQAEKIFQNDLKIAINRARNSYGEGFDKLSPERQAVLIDMSFNMGEIKFPSMIKSLKNNQFADSAKHLLESKYRVQTKSRAYRNAYILKESQIITREQALEKSIQDQLLDKDNRNRINYSNQIADPRIKNILNNTKTDADLAKQLDTMKKAKVGGVSFDFDPLITRLNGMVIDEQSIKVIAGNIYDLSNFSFMDLVVPLKIMYDSNIKSKNISVSLDPFVLTEPDGPWYRKVFYPRQLANTNYGQYMISADFLMKKLSLGVDQNNDPYPYSERLLKMGIDIQSIFKHVEQKNFTGSRTRLWIVIKDYEVGINEKFFQVTNIRMGVQLKALQIGENGSLKDCNDDPSPIAKRFAELFTQHYDELAQLYPILNKMKRLAKASIMAKLMYFKRVPVDMDLIDRLYKKQVRQSEQKLPRLQNKLQKQYDSKIIQLRVLGGCTFDISNMQQKINKLQNEIKQVRELYQAKNLNSNTVPLKSIDNKQNVGQFLFVKNEKDQIGNNKIYPFLFQNLMKCKHCDKLCNLDYYSISNKQCVDHSSMKCKICKELVLPGEKYKANNDKTMIFHEKCFKCSTCDKKIEGPFANIDGGQYHPECVPKKLIGKCEQCKKQIYQGQPCAQNPQTSAYYHAECAKIVNQRIQDSIPKCKFCKVKLQGQYVKYKDEPYHQQCAKKMLMSNT